jgi:ferredoxin/nitrate reductase gamma subunit
MSVTVDPRLMKDIQRYGAFDVSACFNCGNCTAVCPLSEEQGSFPRKLIRLGQIGARERILESPEPWLCYYCGECSDTCPRRAEPGEYMAALRRYTIAAYEPTGVAGWMFKSLGVALLVTFAVAIVLGLFLVGLKPGTDGAAYAQKWLFKSLVPYPVIHATGIGIFILAAITVLAGVGGMVRRVRRGIAGAPMGKRTFAQVRAAVAQTLAEIALMRRHREEPGGTDADKPFLARPSVIHRGIMYGFAGLLAATVLDFAFIVLLPLGTTFWPARIIGTVSGIVLLYGVAAASVRRLRKQDKNAAHSAFADWWVLVVLFLLGVTGFWLLGVVSFGARGAFNDAVLLVHAALAMELVLLVAFTKMAHVLYRPVALFSHFLRVSSIE